VTADETYRARAVVLATGLTPGRLDIPGEERFEGLGLSHCASCDGPLYKGERVMVAGAGKWATQDAIDLAALAAHVSLICPDDAARPSGERAARLAGLANVTVVPGRIVGLEGTQGLDAVVVKRGSARESQPVRAVFVQSNRRAALGFADGLLAVDAEGGARVDGDLCTSDKRAYAAGDVRTGAPEQVSAAIADGQRAGMAVARLLNGSGSGPSRDTAGSKEDAE
jgi:thioredoxin reductase (NADPH)